LTEGKEKQKLSSFLPRGCRAQGRCCGICPGTSRHGTRGPQREICTRKNRTLCSVLGTKITLGEEKTPRIHARSERGVIPAQTPEIWGEGWNHPWLLKGSCQVLLGASSLGFPIEGVKNGRRKIHQGHKICVSELRE